MRASELSVNRKALKLMEKLSANPDEYGVQITKTHAGATLIDAGIEAKGSFEAGRIITEICLGGYGTVDINTARLETMVLPSVFVRTSYPAMSTLGSQFADWQIKQGDYVAIGSGPARALARKNRELFRKIDYRDQSDAAVMVLETSNEPPDSVIKEIARDCSISQASLSLIIAPTASLAGSIQVSGRIVETGLHKLLKTGLDPKHVKHAFGSAPIAPVHPKFVVAMGRTNDAILYAGFAHYDIEGHSDDELEQILKKTPSSASQSYGQPFQQIFKAADYDFYRVDPNLFAPAVVSICNLETGSFLEAGELNAEVLKRSFGFKKL